jgi:hypothetical protein
LSIFSHLENNQLSLLSVCNPSTYWLTKQKRTYCFPSISSLSNIL